MFTFYGFTEIQILQTGLLVVITLLCFMINYKTRVKPNTRVVISVGGSKQIVESFPYFYNLKIRTPGEYRVTVNKEDIT